MGLCKCPKKKVTTLFCFVHRVNVCEDCIVSQHAKCVIQSYLKWLEDSDYDLNCMLCNQSVQEGETVRLLCYDLFHVSCLDHYVKSLPQNTHPSTYKCPKCSNQDILPPANMISPVAQSLRQKLIACGWAKEGSELEQFFSDLSVTQNDSTTPPDEDLTDFTTRLTSTPAKINYSPPPPSAPSYAGTLAASHLEQSSLLQGVTANQGYDQPLIRSSVAGPQTKFVALEASDLGPESGSSKYKRRSLRQMLPRCCQYRLHLTMDETAIMLRRYSILTLLFIFGIVTLILVLTRASQTTDNSPQLHFRPK